MKFGREDFAPLEDFSMKWRWTDPEYTLLAPTELAQIQPLHSSEAQIV